MNASHAELLAKLESFRFESQPVALTFADRLAKDNGWRARYADRVIEEYKRFLFLAVAADHPVSPSDAVDQAWHLHLLYTRSYWDDLCRGVLGQPLHHGPTLGGAAEQDKHDDWYARTLASYRKLLGTEPPPDIWPSLGEWRQTPARYERVDRARFWLMPKPRLIARRQAGWFGFALLPLATLNPFEMVGPQFLGFFAVIFCIALLAGIFLRKRLVVASPLKEEDVQLHAAELAYLNGGRRQVVLALLAAMIQQGSLELRREKKKFYYTKKSRLHAVKPLPPDADSLSQLIHREASGDQGLPIDQLSFIASPLAKRMEESLQDRGLLPQSGTNVAAGLPMALVLLIGVVKIFVGVARGKPVGFLMLGCVVALYAMARLMRSPRLSDKGRRVVSATKDRHAALAENTALDVDRSSADTMLAVALFGLAGTSIPALKELRDSVGTGHASATCGATTGGGCGGGGCGGGGGGGGCGGCGGGD